MMDCYIYEAVPSARCCSCFAEVEVVTDRIEVEEVAELGGSDAATIWSIEVEEHAGKGELPESQRPKGSDGPTITTPTEVEEFGGCERPKRRESTFGMHSKHGVSILFYFIGSMALSIAATAIGFVAFPLANPLHASHMTIWWMCPLSCAVVWQALSTVYVCKLLAQFVHAPNDDTIAFKDFLGMWWVSGAVVFGGLVVLNSLYFPFPMGAYICAPTSFGCMFLYYWNMVLPRIQEHAGDHVKQRVIFVFVFFVGGVIFLLSLIMMCAALNLQKTKDLVLRVLKLPSVEWQYAQMLLLHGAKSGVSKISTMLADRIDEKASLLGKNLPEVGFSIVLCMISTRSVSPQFLVYMVGLDMIGCLLKTLAIGKTKVCGISVGNCLLRQEDCFEKATSCCCANPGDDDMNEKEGRLIQAITEDLVCAQMAEVLTPLSYVVCWIIVRIGPNAAAFTGIGTAQYGVPPPEHVHKFLLNVTFVAGLELVSMFFVQCSLKAFTKSSFYEQATMFLNGCGAALLLQTSWVINSSFCVLMLSCGLDYSFEWHHPKGPN